MNSPSEWLPEELRTKHRKCVSHHNLLVMLLLLIVLITFFAGFALFGKRSVGLGLMLAAAAVEAFGGIVYVFRADARYCAKIGFLCPHCRKPLYYAGDFGVLSPLVARGECPKCHRSVVPG